MRSPTNAMPSGTKTKNPTTMPSILRLCGPGTSGNWREIGDGSHMIKYVVYIVSNTKKNIDDTQSITSTFLLRAKSECICWFTCITTQDAITARSNIARSPPLCQTTYSCSIMTSQKRPATHKQKDRRNGDGSEIWKLTADRGFVLSGKAVAPEGDRKAATGLICSLP
jgi:hypothetical protein